MQKRGIVMQIADGQVVVMTNDCEFRKLPYLEGMAVGQEVEVPKQTTHTTGTVRKKPLSWWGTPIRKTGVMAAAVLLAVGVWGSQSLFTQQTAYAYVTVDINPSVELSIDNHKNVMDVTALNDDAQTVLTDLNVKGMALDKAVESIAEVAKNKGFFRENSEVIITASPAVSNDKLASEHFDLNKMETDLVAQVKTAVTTAGTNIDVEGISVSPQVRDAAKQAGVSPGKYAVYLTAQSNGIDVTVDELKQHSISTVIKNHGQALAALVQKLDGGQQLDQLLADYKKDGGKAKSQPQQPAAVTPPSNGNDTQASSEKGNGNGKGNGPSKQPPGQQKKDAGIKPDPSAGKDNSNQKSDNNSSDREHVDHGQGNKGNSGHDGKQKDGESDRGNRGGNEQKGNNNKNDNDNQNAGNNFANEMWQWIQDHDGFSRNKGQDDKQNHGKQNGHGDH